MWLPGKTVKLPQSSSVMSESRYIPFIASGRLVSVTRKLADTVQLGVEERDLFR